MSSGQIPAFKYHSVMVIDDTYTDRYIAEHYLKKISFASNIILEESASAALAYLEQYATMENNLPQIIFLDIRMPGMDGFEFLDHFQKLPPNVIKQCKIIMTSSTHNPLDFERIHANPLVTKFIAKPLTKTSLENL